MFSAFRRAKAVSVAKTHLNQFLATVTVFARTIPDSIYEDPYVLGYLASIAIFGAQMETRGKLSVEDVGRVSVEAIYAVAGASGRIAAENTIRFSSEQNNEFREGGRQATRMIQVMYGWLGPNDDPEIAKAFSITAENGARALAQGVSDHKSLAAALLADQYFHQHVQTKHQSIET
jgi:hypothetical protein